VVQLHPSVISFSNGGFMPEVISSYLIPVVEGSIFQLVLVVQMDPKMPDLTRLYMGSFTKDELQNDTLQGLRDEHKRTGYGTV
jgi:hypothetical protein